jgi:hypothetical protein
MADENAADALVLRDLVPAEPLLPDPGLPPWAWGLMGAAAVVLLGLVLWLVRRRREPPASDPRVVRDEAYREACQSLDATPPAGIQAAATNVSLVLRRYLAAVCGDPALFETHEEFISRHAALAGFPDELRKITADGFSHLARLKYGRDATGDPAALHGAARQLLDRLHQHTPP